MASTDPYSDDAEPQLPGNRPAEGARHSTPGDLNGGQQPDPGAGDFLGLGSDPAPVELPADPFAEAPGDQADTGESPAGDPRDLDLKDPREQYYEQQEQALDGEPTAAADAGDGGFDGDGYDDGGYDGDFGYDESEDEEGQRQASLLRLEREIGRRKALRRSLAALVFAGLVGGGYYAYDQGMLPSLDELGLGGEGDQLAGAIDAPAAPDQGPMRDAAERAADVELSPAADGTPAPAGAGAEVSEAPAPRVIEVRPSRLIGGLFDAPGAQGPVFQPALELDANTDAVAQEFSGETQLEGNFDVAQGERFGTETAEQLASGDEFGSEVDGDVFLVDLTDVGGALADGQPLDGTETPSDLDADAQLSEESIAALFDDAELAALITFDMADQPELTGFQNPSGELADADGANAIAGEEPEFAFADVQPALPADDVPLPFALRYPNAPVHSLSPYGERLLGGDDLGLDELLAEETSGLGQELAPEDSEESLPGEDLAAQLDTEAPAGDADESAELLAEAEIEPTEQLLAEAELEPSELVAETADETAPAVESELAGDPLAMLFDEPFGYEYDVPVEPVAVTDPNGPESPEENGGVVALLAGEPGAATGRVEVEPQPEAFEPTEPELDDVAKFIGPEADGSLEQDPLPMDPVSEGGAREERSAELTIADQLSLPRNPGGLSMAEPDDFQHMWPHREVPVDAVAGDRQLLTPKVGGIRLHASNDEVFDGRLFAVGRGSYVIENRMGRMTLSADEIVRVERLAAVPRELRTTPYVATGERVQVRTAGGYVYGHVLSESDERVLLLTENGARLSLSDATVEPATQTRAGAVLANIRRPD